MLPIILSIGPVKIYAYGLFLVIGLFLGLYFWWKMGRDEHFDEIALFDGFFLSLLIFFLVGRVGYVLAHLDQFESWGRALAVLAYPGVSGSIGLLAVVIFMYFFAKAHDWQVWKVGDCVAVSLSVILVFVNLGGVLNGSNPGLPASWGIFYPGSQQAMIPLDILMFVWALLSFGIVSRVRKNFRFYSWYKGEASTAQEGLASLVFVFLVGVYYMIIPWMTPDIWRVGVLPVQFLGGVGLAISSGWIVYNRVGKRDNKIREIFKSLIRRK